MPRLTRRERQAIRQPYDDRLERVCGGRAVKLMAAHEAGHAIVALACGVEVKSAALQPPEPIVKYGPGACTWFMLGTIAAAGQIIDIRNGFAEAHRNVPKRDPAQDVHQMNGAAYGIMNSLPLRDTGGTVVELDIDDTDRVGMNALLGGFRNAADEILRANIAGAQSIAAELFEKRFLSQAEIVQCAGELRRFTPDEVERLVTGYAFRADVIAECERLVQ
jgi:hypothetical protein